MRGVAFPRRVEIPPCAHDCCLGRPERRSEPAGSHHHRFRARPRPRGDDHFERAGRTVRCRHAGLHGSRANARQGRNCGCGHAGSRLRPARRAAPIAPIGYRTQSAPHPLPIRYGHLRRTATLNHRASPSTHITFPLIHYVYTFEGRIRPILEAGQNGDVSALVARGPAVPHLASRTLPAD